VSYEEQIQQISEVISNPDYVKYCCMEMRPGVRAWMTEIEYTKFRPGTLDNDDFHLAILKWPEGQWGMRYLIICFHRSAQEFAESTLWRNGLRKCEEGAYPMMFGGTEKTVDIGELIEKGSLEFKVMGPEPKWEEFPLRGNNIFFLENHSMGAANVVYSGDPEKMKKARDLEDAQQQVFFDAHEEWMKTPEAKKSMDEYIKKHPDGFNI
jgi:hypothetical protein